ncbi:endonuclease domain-containing protein [Patescibacteria group bacterium]|nr:endonuclease domain-containing protein [Patescibacteria group bacterium]
MTELFNQKLQTPLRKKLRKDNPSAEYLLWMYLRKKQLDFRFRRQFGIGTFVVDFYCPKAKLVIEVDGDTHYQKQTPDQYDVERQRYIESKGLKVLRFTNLDVYRNIEGVIQVIRDNLPPAPSLVRRGRDAQE